MAKLSLLFLVLLVTTTYAQIGPDGTGTVRGYSIGPGANLSNADLFFANLENADLFGANLSNAVLTVANLTNANLTNADLTGVISGIIIGTPTLPTGYKMVNGYIVGPSVDLTNADLTGATLTGVTSGNITGTPTLPGGYQMMNGYIVGPGVDLSGADLTNTDLEGADLTNTDLEGADLRGADLSGADLEGADLEGALLSGTIWSNVISQSDYDAVVAERDAALEAQASAEAESNAKLTLEEVKDLRAGSTMITVENGQATLSMEVEQSDDLEVWNTLNFGDDEQDAEGDNEEQSISASITVEDGTRFYRFKLDD